MRVLTQWNSFAISSVMKKHLVPLKGGFSTRTEVSLKDRVESGMGRGLD